MDSETSSAEDQDLSGDEKETPEGVLAPPRDASGTPSNHDEKLTEEAEDAIDTEVATGDSVDERGRPLKTEPPPTSSSDS